MGFCFIPTKEQYAKDKEKYRVKYQEWLNKDRETNRINQNERTKKWRSEHPEQYRAIQKRITKKWKKEHPDKVIAQRIKDQYGISLDEYLAMMKAQGGKCKACGKESKLCVDHDHESGKVRGLLCQGCNAALGFVKDNKVTLLALVAYLS